MAKGKKETSPPAIETLAQAALAGDKTAYAQFLREAAQQIARKVTPRLHHYDDKDDVVQDILIAVDKALHTYDISRPFLPWLNAIIQFRFTDYLRKTYRNQARHYVEFSEIEQQLSDEEDVTESGFDNELLHKEVAALPKKQAEVVRLLKLEEYSVKEVAAKLKMSESNVKVTAHRAYKTLRVTLGKNES